MPSKPYDDIAMVERRIAALTAAQSRDAGRRQYVAIRARTIEPLAFDPDDRGGYAVRAVYLEQATRFRTSAEARQMIRLAHGFTEEDGAKICPLADLYALFLRCLRDQHAATRGKSYDAG
jgi:hypothetical protein